jgi:ferredoxin-fold anticodon binding domain-containing protein
MACVRDELKTFIGRELLIDIIGKDFAPKGVLKSVEDDFIILGETRIPITSIANFKPCRGGY